MRMNETILKRNIEIIICLQFSLFFWTSQKSSNDRTLRIKLQADHFDLEKNSKTRSTKKKSLFEAFNQQHSIMSLAQKFFSSSFKI